MPPDQFAEFVEIFRRLSRPLEPIATGETPVLRQLPGIRAVLFDVYGTLLISGSGDVGTAAEAASRQSLVGALHAVGLDADEEVAAQGLAVYFPAIEASQAKSRLAGIDYPEVDIVAIWRTVIDELCRRDLVEPAVCPSVDLRRLAVEYEARANPCWPMPDLRKCLDRLGQAGLLLGIISNAQFYTPPLLAAMLGRRAENCGFDPRLQYYSYRYGMAKPGPNLFRLAAEALAARGITPDQTIYVGNDMLNDINPARKQGFGTALFAGDARSLRRRRDEPEAAEVQPDLVLTNLTELWQCMIV